MAELLLPAFFDLGFRALHAFGGDARPVRTFAAAAGALARAGEPAALRGMLQRIQGTVTPDEWDEVQLSLDKYRFDWTMIVYLYERGTVQRIQGTVTPDESDKVQPAALGRGENPGDQAPQQSCMVQCTWVFVCEVLSTATWYANTMALFRVCH